MNYQIPTKYIIGAFPEQYGNFLKALRKVHESAREKGRSDADMASAVRFVVNNVDEPALRNADSWPEGHELHSALRELKAALARKNVPASPRASAVGAVTWTLPGEKLFEYVPSQEGMAIASTLGFDFDELVPVLPKH